MWKLIRNNRGAAAVEFALVSLPVLTFIIGIIQTGWVVWIDNLLHASANAAARCGAVNSTTSPCTTALGSLTGNMISTANTVFGPLTGASFIMNPTCSGAGLIGTYTVNVAFVINLTLTAKSCYPTVVAPS